MKKGQKVRIYWDDAVFYTKSDSPLKIKPSPKVIEGSIVLGMEKYDEYEEFVTVAIDEKNKSLEMPEERITFFSVPKGMVKKIEVLSGNPKST